MSGIEEETAIALTALDLILRRAALAVVSIVTV
jgi:hypothetical protein